MAAMVEFKNSFGRSVYGIPISAEMPPNHESVILFIEDADVAIHGCAVVGWNSGTDKTPLWWTGVPGRYIALGEQRWTVTHWRPLSTDRSDGVSASDSKTQAPKGPDHG